MDSPLDNQKQELRKTMRTTLRSLSADDKSESAQSLCQKVHAYLGTLPEGSLVIASFAALPSEPNLRPLLTMLPEHTFVYPKCGADGTMDFYPVGNYEELLPGEHQILEPPTNKISAIPIDSIAVFLCPAFAFTASGARLGKGGGYYDRALEKRSASSKLIGIGFDCQLLPTLPTTDHDIPMDLVITA